MHERSLRIVYRDYNSSFKDLPKKNNSVCIHHRNIQSLAVELFKVTENLCNTIMSDIFPNRVFIKPEFKITNRFFHKYRQHHKIWFKLIKICCIESLDTYRN